MKKIKLIIILALCYFCINSSHAQFAVHLTFTNPTIVGNKFRVSLHLASVGTPWYLGTHNFRINYSTAALSNPVIYSEIFAAPDFQAATYTGSNPTSGILSLNTILNHSFMASGNINPVFISNTGVDVMVVEWTIINPNVPVALNWRVAPFYTTAKVAITDNGINNPTGGGMGLPASTPITIQTAAALTMPNLNQVSAGPDVSIDCNSPTATLTATGGGSSYLWNTGETTQSIIVSPISTTTYSVTATNGSSDAVVVDYTGCTTVSSRVYLPKISTTSFLMSNDLTGLANFPISDPYAVAPLNAKFVHVNSGAVATTTPLVLAITGNDAIVDWMFLELRTGVSGSTSVAYTKAALLQADGDIVDIDGVSSVQFKNAVPGDYYVAVRHRNHLGFRTANKVAVSNNTSPLDFTSGSVLLNGATPMTTLASSNVNVMNGGDSNSDGSIDAFDTIIWEIHNGLFDDYTNNADYNMDGSVDAFDTIIWELNNGKFQELD